jgi:hypothetical protein
MECESASDSEGEDDDDDDDVAAEASSAAFHASKQESLRKLRVSSIDELSDKLSFASCRSG